MSKNETRTKVQYTEVETFKDYETGEIIEKKTKRVIKTDEPNFIKLYLKDICKLNDVPKSGNDTLNHLLQLMDYNNEIVLNSTIKKRIYTAMGISKASLDNNISKLVKADIIRRVDRGVYMLNPDLFGKGKWEDIKELKVTYKYTKSGRTLESLERKDYEQMVMDI